MTAKSRNKGARREREIADRLHELLGIRFERNLEQCRHGGGDLIADDPAFPFCIEIKARASGDTDAAAWRKQCVKAAAEAELMPCLIVRYDRRPPFAMLRICDVERICGRTPKADPAHWMRMPLNAFAYWAREAMAKGEWK